MAVDKEEKKKIMLESFIVVLCEITNCKQAVYSRMICSKNCSSSPNNCLAKNGTLLSASG